MTDKNVYEDDAAIRKLVADAKVAPLSTKKWEKMSERERHDACEELAESLVSQICSMQAKTEEKVTNAVSRLQSELEAVGRKMRTVQGIEHVFNLMRGVDEDATLKDAASMAYRFAVKADEFARSLALETVDGMDDLVEGVYDHDFSETFALECTEENATAFFERYIEELLRLDLARMAGNAVTDIVSFRDAAKDEERKVAENLETLMKRYPDLWSVIPQDDEGFPSISCPYDEKAE